jgi:hypothetical protein
MRAVKKRRVTPHPPEPDATARLLLALRHYLDRGLPLDEAVAAANWALRRRLEGDEVR